MSDEPETGRPPEESQTDLEPRRVTSANEATALTSGAVLADRYEIRQVIGRGGMGLVLEAYDRLLDESVAIKIVRAEYAGEREWAERLARETKLARQIHHPNVCRVFDFEQASGHVFLVMELATGGSLRTEMVSGVTQKRTLADRLGDVRALTAGLAAIHSAGIIHRDVSPQNVLRMSDGRLVVSDFGLATDSFESTTSLHGGTIAYMAPELVRGRRANVASDIWAAGVVIHEIMFGERPHWRPGADEMSNPISGRRSTATERAILDVCRACTTTNPERRPRNIAEIEKRLNADQIQWSNWRGWLQRTVAVAGVGLAIAGAVAGVRRPHARSPAGAVAGSQLVADPPLIVPTGAPDDWTDKSTVLAEVPDVIRCTSLLPDHKTVRFVWGIPAQAMDVDTHTGHRKPSPLVPAAYAEGCPDVSPDGQRIVYTGHTSDNRAFAFVSTHLDGSKGVPVVPIAEPTMLSDPSWLPDSQSFSYEADLTSMAIFSTVTNRSIILPRANRMPSLSTFRHVLQSQIATTTIGANYETDVVVWEWPSLVENRRFRYPSQILDLHSRDSRTYYCSITGGEGSIPIVEITPDRSLARPIGSVRNQLSRFPLFVNDGLSFVSTKRESRVEICGPDGLWSPITSGRFLWGAAPCGHEIVAGELLEKSSVIVRLDRRGHIVRQMTTGPLDGSPACSPDGRVLFYVSASSHDGFNGIVNRCDSDGCRTLLDNGGGGLAISPDGRRLSFFSADNRGLMTRWISTEGGETHDLVETETACTPVWSSDRTLWVSRRRGEKTVWSEIDVDTRIATGRILPGTRDCADGFDDPASPVTSDVRTTAARRSQLRLLPEKFLPTD